MIIQPHNKFTIVLFCAFLALLCQGEIITMWSGGTNDVRAGVVRTFLNLSSSSAVYLKAEVYATDFSDRMEYIDMISVNSRPLTRQCDPNMDEAGRYFVCVKDVDVSSDLDGNGDLTVRITASNLVNLQPYKGYVLFCRITLSDTFEPTMTPTSIPSNVPTTPPSSIPTAIPTISQLPTGQPTAIPTSIPSPLPTSIPTISLPPTSVPSSQPSSQPTSAPSSSYPTLTPPFEEKWIGGTNDVKAGVHHTFYGMHGYPNVYLQVDVFNTDFDHVNEYVNKITVNNNILKTHCTAPSKTGRNFFTCVFNEDVAPLMTAREGAVTVSITATDAVNCCHYNTYLLYVRFAVRSIPASTRAPTVMPTLSPTVTYSPTLSPIISPTRAPVTAKPTFSHTPTRAPTSSPTVTPTRAPTSAPTRKPTAVPTVSPTFTPTTATPSLSPGFLETFEGGTNSVTDGVKHTFFHLAGHTEVYLRVEVYETDFSDPGTEYVFSITANGVKLSSYCSPGVDKGRKFYLCLVDQNVASYIDDKTGALTVRARATMGVNSYPYAGKLFYVKFTVSNEMSPTVSPTSSPTRKPTSSPTISPTFAPTSQPTFIPTTEPTSKPTRSPTFSPTSKPTRTPTHSPSSAPSSIPTSSPTSSVPTILPTFTDTSPYVWIGGSGNWEDGSNWNRREAPPIDSTVIISASTFDLVTITENITISQLNLTSGRLNIASNNTALHVTQLFNFSGGSLWCSANNMQCWYINEGTSYWSGNKKLLSYATFINRGRVYWHSGDVVMSSATVDNTRDAEFYMDSSQSLTMRPDTSYYDYVKTSNAILNPNVNLQYHYPPLKAVYDKVAESAVYVTVDTNSLEIWSLQVAQDAAAANYYAYVANLAEYPHTMYNATAAVLDADACAELCVAYSNWCKSFDYAETTHFCMLSQFLTSDIGGLYESLETDHFEVSETVQDFSESVMINGGTLVVTESTNITLNVMLHASSDAQNYINVSSAGSITISGGGTFSTLTTVYLCASSLTIKDESFDMHNGATIRSTCRDVASASLSLESGSHSLTSELHDVNLNLRNSAIVDVPSAWTNQIPSISLTNGSALYLLRNGEVVNVTTFNIAADSVVYARNISIYVDSLQISGMLSASGYGYLPGTGPAAGSNSTRGASGGGHGGRGGVGNADNVGVCYGSVTDPRTAGSGGGCFDNNLDGCEGGAGGGIIFISGGSVTIDGEIHADGASGTTAGGGGAGGSLYLIANSLDGRGSITARGGDGGFAGGWLGGGGGGGGRIALHVTSLNYNGTLDASQGYRPFTFGVDAEPAGTGSVYIEYSNSTSGSVIHTLIIASQSFPLILDAHENLAYDNEDVDSPINDAVVYRGMHLSDFSQFESKPVNIHILGYSPLVIDGEGVLRINDILSTGPNATIHVINGQIDFSVDLINTVLFVRNNSLANSTLRVGTGSNIKCVDDAGSQFSFENLHFLDGSTLSYMNSSITVTATELQVTDATIVIAGDNATLVSPDARLESTIVIGTLPDGSSYVGDEFDLLKLSLLFDEGNIVNTLTVTNVSVVNALNFTFTHGSSLNIQAGGTFDNAERIMIEGNITIAEHGGETVNYANPSDCSSNTVVHTSPMLFTHRREGQIIVKEDAICTVEIPVSIFGNVFVHGGAMLNFEAGGTCTNDCIIDIAADAQVTFINNALFEFNASLVRLTGIGSVNVKGGVRFPHVLTTQPSITVKSGCVLMNRIDHATTIHSITIDGGSVYVSERETTFKNLTLSSGTLHIVNTTVNIEENMLFKSGTIMGTGNLAVSQSGKMIMDPQSIGNATILEVTILNMGTVSGEVDGVVFWGREAILKNHNLLVLSNNHRWIPAADIYAFNAHLESTLLDWVGVKTFVNVTLEKCLNSCLHRSYETSRRVSRQQRVTETHICRAAQYNGATETCKIHVLSAEDVGVASDSARGKVYAWDAYSVNMAWIGSSSIDNSENGTISVNNGEATVCINIANAGTLEIDSGAVLKVDGGYDQSAGGSALVSGNFKVSERGSRLSGSFSGQGQVTLLANDIGYDHIIVSDLLSPGLKFLIEDASMMATSTENITLQFSEFVIDAGIVTLATRTKVNATSILLRNGTLFQSARDVVVNDATSFACDQDVCGDVAITADSLTISSSSSMLFSRGKLSIATLTLETNGTLSCSSRGYLLRHSNQTAPLSFGVSSFLSSSGGSHGGTGGRVSEDVSHGVYYAPETWGCPGGGDYLLDNSDTDTAGGGSLRIIADTMLIDTDSSIECNGKSPETGIRGGGAGGSIYITTTYLGGSGSISAKGGSGSGGSNPSASYGGGGGGGRVSVVYENKNDFTGVVSASGGRGGGDAGTGAGAAGTVFFISNDELSGISSTGGELIIDNSDGSPLNKTASTLISIPSPYKPLASLTVTNTQLMISIPNGAFQVHDVHGDGKSSIRINSGTILWASSTEPLVSELHTSYGLTNRQTLYIANLNMIVDDAVLNVSSVVVGSAGKAYLTEEGRSLSGSTAGEYIFDLLYVLDDGQTIVTYNDVLHCVTENIRVNLLVNTLAIAATGAVHSDHMGYIGVDPAVAEENSTETTFKYGPGRGEVGFVGASGGGYGGIGGDGVSVLGGTAYGNYTYPRDFGSGGGGTFRQHNGGSGGGVLVVTSTLIDLNGTISANGASGNGRGAGGGSGGSILLITSILSGSGNITASGGRGRLSPLTLAGAGAGGRISLSVSSSQNGFNGAITAHGGLIMGELETEGYWVISGKTIAEKPIDMLRALDTGALRRAASGTVYLHIPKVPAGFTNNLKIDNSHNQTLLVSYTEASLNGAIIRSNEYTLASAPSYIFPNNENLDEISLVNHGHLSIANGTIVADTLSNSGSLDNAVTVTDGARIHLLNETEFEDFTFVVEGEVVGVVELILRGKAAVMLHPAGSWAFDENSLVPGTVSIDSIVLYDTSSMISKSDNFSIVTIQCGNLVIDSSTAFITADGEGHSGAAVTRSSVYVGASSVNIGEGGTHAGLGGRMITSDSAEFGIGDAYAPQSPGYGGGSTYVYSGGNGGGVVRIDCASGIVNNGRISADGSDATCDDINMCSGGGGAGGSVYISLNAGSITGTGVISANGGNSDMGGGGSGGRIAVLAATSLDSFAGSVSALGGRQGSDLTVAPAGGTVFAGLADSSQGTLVVASAGDEFSGITSSTFTTGGGTAPDAKTVSRVILSHYSSLSVSGPNLTSTGSLVHLSHADSHWRDILPSVREETNISPELLVDLSSSLIITEDLSIVNYTFNIASGHVVVGGNVIIGEDGVLSMNIINSYICRQADLQSIAGVCNPETSRSFLDARNLTILPRGELSLSSSSDWYDHSFTLNVEDTLIVESEGILHADSVFASQDVGNHSVKPHLHFGASCDVSCGGAGGGHAGVGGVGYDNRAAGVYRGAVASPIGGGGAGGTGSIGRGGYGGGGLSISVGNSCVVNGVISANGGSASVESGAGGGAGGSISLNVKGVLSGSGSIRANGGHGSISNSTAYLIGGGGSGGRIMLTYCSGSNFVDTGNISSLGGLYMSSKPFPSGQGVYESHFAIEEGSLSNYHIVAAAAGTEVRREYSDDNECTLQSDIFAQQLLVRSWSDVDIASVGDLSMIALQRYFGAVVVDRSDTTSITLSNITHDVKNPANTFSKCTLSNVKAAAEVTGGGTIVLHEIISGSDTSITIADDTRVYFASDIILSNSDFSLNGGFVRQDDSNHSVSLVDSTFTIGTNSYAITAGNHESSQLHFSYVSLVRSTIQGALVNISAEQITLTDHSHLTASALGYKGGDAGQLNAGGSGAGSWGESGGSGGGHGGHGRDSLNAAYRRDVLETVLGSSGSQISLGSNMEGGGSSYGDWRQPLSRGSGGGATSRAAGRGGNGGGMIYVICSGDITISDQFSTVSADGESVYGGGGGGAGGSIYLSADVLHGTGYIRSNGGKTCYEDDCTADVDMPAGGGGGGRVLIDANIHAFSGHIQARCGCGESENITRSIQRFMGSITRRLPVVAILRGTDDTNEEYVDVVSLVTPLWPVITITTNGSGVGDRYANNEGDAIVRGTFRIGYKSKKTIFLSPQISAAELKAELDKLPNIGQISVNRNESDHGGWKWEITFHSDTGRIPRMTVDGSRLYTTNNDASISAVTSHHESTSVATYYDSAAGYYNASILSNEVTFSDDILDADASYGFWRPGGSVFRIFPKTNVSLDAYVNNLTLVNFFPLPNQDGSYRGITEAVLQNSVDYGLEVPTSIPTNVPSSLPTGIPSSNPTSIPSSYPTSNPSSYPTSIPSSWPTCVPTSCPSSKPSSTPTSAPT